jgi:hypothetical protein
MSMMLLEQVGWGQSVNGYLDFGTPANGTTPNSINTGFGGVRVGTGGGGFTLQNPGQSIGANGELRGIAPVGGSVNSVGISSAEYGTAATTFTISFELHMSGGSSGNWYFFAGNGNDFGSSQSNAFTGASIFTGIQWVFGASNAITTNNRASSSWSTISGTPFAQNTAYFVTVMGNNSSSTVIYGASNEYSISAYKYDLWVNGVLLGDELGKALLANGSIINAFRFYGENSASNVATIALDNIRWYNTCVIPPTHLALASVPSMGTVGTNLSNFRAETRSGSASGPVANSFNGAITITKVSGAGTISGTLASNASSGIATFSGIQFSSADTYTINATAAAPILTSAISGNIVVSAAGTLPATLLSFSGYKDGIRNQLRWVTSSEINNSGFQVERSSDGQSYQSIGFVNSLAIGGNSQTLLKYNFSDAQPAGIKQYYRLKQTDIDGRNTLSNILLVQGEKPTAFEIASVFPNPTRGQITMLLSAPTNETVNIRVMDLAGRILETRQVNVLTGNNSIPFDLSKQAKGQYLISVGEKLFKIVKE